MDRKELIVLFPIMAVPDKVIAPIKRKMPLSELNSYKQIERVAAAAAIEPVKTQNILLDH
jgi:hypothetical protein